MIKVVSNVLTKQELFTLYKGLLDTNFWSINANAVKTNNTNVYPNFYPGVELLRNGEPLQNNPYWIGYFSCLFDRINQKLLEQHNFILNRNIFRIRLNAQDRDREVDFHVDHHTNESVSIVGFLTPDWSTDWKGGLNVEGKTYEYKPGDFIVFDSNIMHKPETFVKQNLYWRISVNYVIKKSYT